MQRKEQLNTNFSSETAECCCRLSLLCIN